MWFTRLCHSAETIGKVQVRPPGPRQASWLPTGQLATLHAAAARNVPTRAWWTIESMSTNSTCYRQQPQLQLLPRSPALLQRLAPLAGVAPSASLG